MANAKNRKLSKGQKECLRLVLAHLNSKEIGRELDISPHTVDQRLRGAMRILDTSTRFEAARKFAELEGEKTYQPLIHQSSDIENSDETDSLNSSAGGEKEVGNNLISGISNIENGTAILDIGNFKDTESQSSLRPFPLYHGEKNELSVVGRLGWIIVIAIGVSLSFGGILAGLEALSRLRG